jgi:hypothetical protein
MYYEKQYNSKPDSNETKKIQKLLHKTEIDIKELAFGFDATTPIFHKWCLQEKR